MKNIHCLHFANANAPGTTWDDQAKDSDNETALEAILSLSQEEPEEEALKVLHGRGQG